MILASGSLSFKPVMSTGMESRLQQRCGIERNRYVAEKGFANNFTDRINIIYSPLCFFGNMINQQNDTKVSVTIKTVLHT